MAGFEFFSKQQYVIRSLRKFKNVCIIWRNFFEKDVEKFFVINVMKTTMKFTAVIFLFIFQPLHRHLLTIRQRAKDVPLHGRTTL